MKVLAVADLHYWDCRELRRYLSLDYDLILLLGDIPAGALCEIKARAKAPILGVLGNHDELNQLEKCGIPDISGKSVTLCGVNIAGIGGSSRYKRGDFPMLTQRESKILAKRTSAADILISHDTAFGFMGQKDTAHCGLREISDYIRQNKPAVNLFGHYHTPMRKKYGKCEMICVYRFALMTLDNGNLDIEQIAL